MQTKRKIKFAQYLIIIFKPQTTIILQFIAIFMLVIFFCWPLLDFVTLVLALMPLLIGIALLLNQMLFSIKLIRLLSNGELILADTKNYIDTFISSGGSTSTISKRYKYKLDIEFDFKGKQVSTQTTRYLRFAEHQSPDKQRQVNVLVNPKQFTDNYVIEKGDLLLIDILNLQNPI